LRADRAPRGKRYDRNATLQGCKVQVTRHNQPEEESTKGGIGHPTVQRMAGALSSTQEERTVIDWEQIEKDLYAMKSYFEGCAANAQLRSEAREKFAGYVQTLTCLAVEIEEMLKGEDDGK